MPASGGIETFVGYPQAFDGTVAEDMRLHDFVHVSKPHVTVPGGFGIHHDGRTVFALVQASGLVGAHRGLNSALGQMSLKGTLQFGAPGWIAAAARMSVGTLIGADEDMFLELRHGGKSSQPGW